MEKPWKTIRSESLLKTPIFEILKEECEMPDGRIMPAYYRVDCTDWVNVVPFTSDGKILMIRQYRHASGQWHWEIPGGAMSRRNGESALLAAQRELSEETGFTSTEWVDLGPHWPNPALQSNKLHTFIARNCKKTDELNLDPYEELTLHELTVDEVKALIRSRQINHSLMMASIACALME